MRWCAPDGSVAAHAVVCRTLADLACATNLQVKDAVSALNKCRLLIQREGKGDMIMIMISWEMVEAITQECNVKQMGQSLVTSANMSVFAMHRHHWL
jgi:hypothetical protein